jgi:EAL and modified HD-GYP domain-containing signal transduction protein
VVRSIEQTSAMSQVFLARQPIFDRHRRLAGYELLFRGRDEDRAVITNHDDATSKVAMNTLTEFGLERVVGPHRAWVNVTRSFILEGLAGALPAKRVALELLENQEVDDTLLAALRDLHSRGYPIVLDDFVYEPTREPLLPLADTVKIDIMAQGVERAVDQAKQLRKYDVKLLAEKVETHEEFELCAHAGFSLFQGYFFCKPELMRHRAIGANKLSLLQLLAALQDPEIELSELKRLVERDVALSLRLLRYINSAFFGLRTRVDSISRAIALLGLANVKRWATMTVFAGIEGKPRELIATALVRGRMCELLGPEINERNADQLFTLGLFSVVDALMDAPMAEVLHAVPFSEDMVAALTSRAGRMGALLDAVLCWERGDVLATRSPVTPDKIGAVHVDALAWAQQAAGELFDEGTVGEDEGDDAPSSDQPLAA